jgi:hypothetical protein
MKEMKSPNKKYTCIHIFIEELFSIAKMWNQPKYPSTDGWAKNVICKEIDK